ncbi:MAG TPA: hypothetical protein VMU22_03675 [Rhizomicrobium sp.]|nr:hypothetical protein [Rhizomicrobium sp.]
MDRRYYGLKALVVALGIGVAVYSSFFDTRPLLSNSAHTHYSAAASVQNVVASTTVRISRAVGKFIFRNDCLARNGL